ncbi:MAG: MiaB/RimO family radical SAM methylthiotransferase [Spirochaetaceae bacterium]
MSRNDAPESAAPSRITVPDSLPARMEGAGERPHLPGGRAQENDDEPRAPRVAFQTLGCKLNQYETDSLAADFEKAGYRVVPFEDSADVYVLNTCTVTNRADRKSRNLLYRALRAAGASSREGEGSRERGAEAGADPGETGPGALVVLTGCFVEGKTQAITQGTQARTQGKTQGTLLESAGVAYTDPRSNADDSDEALDGRRLMVVDNPRKARIVELVEARRRGEVVVPGELDPNLFGFHFAPVFRTRTTVKVQDGCDNFCTYCIVPFVRGCAASRPADQVVAEVAESVRTGAREIVLTGVNMSRYQDGDTPFSALVERVLEIPGEFRVRISSLEPDSIDDRFFAVMQHPKMCPHLHLCLQSGSDRILLKMRRQYDTRGFRDIVARIRRDRPDFNFTTDIIAGFPGETDEDFADTVAMAREIGFSHIHTFPYSLRSRTRAARMPDHVPSAEKTRRAEVIRTVAEENKRRYRASLVGATQHVLVERPEPAQGREHGYGELYVPVRIVGAPRGGAARGGDAPDAPDAPDAADTAPPELPRNSLVAVELTTLDEGTTLGEGTEPVLLGRPI